MRAYLPAVAGLLLIAITAWGTFEHGRYTNRWNASDEVLGRAATALVEAPLEFGPWRMQSEQGFSARIRAILSYAAAVNRVYVNEKTGQAVAVAMLVGPPGPTSTHTAELCYKSTGNRLLEPTSIMTVDSERGANEFRRNLFESESVEGERLEVATAWRQGELWTAPEVPRVTFGGKPYLFKIQIAAGYDAVGNESNEHSICKEFLAELLPALETSVFTRFKPE